MDDFEKLETIVRGKIADYKKRIERARSGIQRPLYVEDLESELKGFQIISAKMRDIKIGGFGVSDDGDLEKVSAAGQIEQVKSQLAN